MRFVIAIVSAAVSATAGVGHASSSHDIQLCSGKVPTVTAKAIDACNRLLGKAAGNSGRLSHLYLLRGNRYREAGQLDRAIKDYSRAIRHDPQNKTAFYNRGSAYRSLKRYQEAIDDLSRCLRLAPRLHLAQLERGMAFLSIKKFRRAIADFTAGMGPAEMPYFLLLRARAYIGANMKDKAAADLRKALKLANAAIMAPAEKIRTEARDALRRLGAAAR